MGALENKYNSLKSNIAKKTELLLTEQEDALNKQRSMLESSLDKIISDIEKEQNILQGYQVSSDSAKKELETLIRERENIEKDIDDLLLKKKVLQSALDELSVTQQNLENSMQTLEKELITKEKHLSAVVVDTENAQATQDGLNKAIAALSVKHESMKKQYDSDISELEAKLHNTRNELLSNTQDQEKVRQELASTAKMLHEKEINLRVREAKVQQNEEVIQRNAGLLRL